MGALSDRTSRAAVGLIALALFGASGSALHAEVTVEGTPAALRVTTESDAIADVMAALVKSFNVRYRSAIRLEGAASAAYSGSLGEVISRVLEGYSYVIRKDQDSFEVVVVGTNGARPVPVRAPAPAGTNITSKWR